MVLSKFKYIISKKKGGVIMPAKKRKAAPKKRKAAPKKRKAAKRKKK